MDRKDISIGAILLAAHTIDYYTQSTVCCKFGMTNNENPPILNPPIWSQEFVRVKIQLKMSIEHLCICLLTKFIIMLLHLECSL